MAPSNWSLSRRSRKASVEPLSWSPLAGIGAKMVANWLQDEMKVPVSLVNDYTLPAYVDENTNTIYYVEDTDKNYECNGIFLYPTKDKARSALKKVLFHQF